MYGIPRPPPGGNRRRGRRNSPGGMGEGLRGRQSSPPQYYSGSDSGSNGYDSRSDDSGSHPIWGADIPNGVDRHWVREYRENGRRMGGYWTSAGPDGRPIPGAPREYPCRGSSDSEPDRAMGSAGSGGYGGGYDSRDGSPGPMGGRRGGYGGVAPGMGGLGERYGGQGRMIGMRAQGGRLREQAGGRLTGMTQDGRRRGGRREEDPGPRLGSGGRFGESHGYGGGAGAGLGGRYRSSSPPRGRPGFGGRQQRSHEVYGGGGAFPDSGEESW